MKLLSKFPNLFSLFFFFFFKTTVLTIHLISYTCPITFLTNSCLYLLILVTIFCKVLVSKVHRGYDLLITSQVMVKLKIKVMPSHVLPFSQKTSDSNDQILIKYWKEKLFKSSRKWLKVGKNQERSYTLKPENVSDLYFCGFLAFGCVPASCVVPVVQNRS